MKIITFDDIQKLNISPVSCYEWASNVILHKNETLLPTKIHMAIPNDSFINVMPSVIHEKRSECELHSIGGVKVISRYPQRAPSLDSRLLLMDADSGEYLALMDANWITAMRTGAVAAHSVVHLAKEGYSVISMIGLGNIARAFFIILSAIIPDKKLTIRLLKYKDQAQLFLKRFSDLPNVQFEMVDSVEDAIRGTDVVVSCATYFENDIAKDEWFDAGVLVIPVHTRSFTNCDLFFDKVFADDTGHVCDFKNFSKFKFYSEMTDVVNHLSVGRENNCERILAYNIGISIHDVFFGEQIYRIFQNNKELFDNLAEISMHEPTEKFWA